MNSPGEVSKITDRLYRSCTENNVWELEMVGFRLHENISHCVYEFRKNGIVKKEFMLPQGKDALPEFFSWIDGDDED